MDRFGVELRAEIAGDILRGHAAVFDSLAKLPTGYEAIDRGAFDDVLARDDLDVRALVNHDPSQLLGRTPNTLRLSTDKTGLAFEVDLPDTRAAHDIRTLIRRGDISGASFGFVPGATVRSHAPDGRPVTTHMSVSRLLDVSVVTYPAYGDASVQLRHRSLWAFDSPAARQRRTQQITARFRALQALRRA